MAKNMAKLQAMARALKKAKPEREERGEAEPRGSTPAMEALEEAREGVS